MDRDIVNAIHHLYKNGPMPWATLDKILFCLNDTRPPIEMYTNEVDQGIKLSDELVSFIKDVESQMEKLPPTSYAFGFPFADPVRQPGQKRHCFVAMPYSTTWFEPVKTTIESAIASTKFEAEISGDLNTPGKITDQIWQGIRRSEVVIADITDNNPNVFYELGLAHALGKEVIILQQIKEGEIIKKVKVPFDIQDSRICRYSISKLSELKERICKALESVSDRYEFDRD